MSNFVRDTRINKVYRLTNPENTFEIFTIPSRKYNKIAIRTDERSPNVAYYTLKIYIYMLHTCFFTFPLQPYYSRGENSKFYSTSQYPNGLSLFGHRSSPPHKCSQQINFNNPQINVFEKLCWANNLDIMVHHRKMFFVFTFSFVVILRFWFSEFASKVEFN